MIADFFVLRRGHPTVPENVERFNWAGVVALLVGAGVGYWLQDSGTSNLGFLVTLVLTPAVYVGLRSTVLPEGTGTSTVATDRALQEQT
jgi:cytosine permease